MSGMASGRTGARTPTYSVWCFNYGAGWIKHAGEVTWSYALEIQEHFVLQDESPVAIFIDGSDEEKEFAKRGRGQ